MLACASCGHEDPEGSRFCGSCGAPFVPLATEPPSPRPAAEEPSRVAPPATSDPKGMRGLRRVAVGAAVAVLVAGGAVAGVLTLSGGDDATEASPTEQPLPTRTSEPLPSSSPTPADSVAPYLEELAALQGALIAQVTLLEPGAKSLAKLQYAGDALAARVVVTQEFLDGLVPADSREASTLSLLRRALAEHLAYAEAISGLSPRTRDFTNAQARATMARAEQARRAYVSLVAESPALPVVYISGSDHNALLAVVPSTTPLAPATRRVVDLVPLLVGIRPDDPPGEGRCFGPYAGASLRVSGVVYRSGFIQCGDEAAGDPSRASGVYRFSGPAFPAGSRLVRMTGQAVIDEFSSPSQRGSSVTWAVFYDDAPICSGTVVWSGPRPSPTKLDCRLPSAVTSGKFDVRRLRIQQDASLASSGTLWAGLFHPTIVVEVPR